MSIFKTAKSGEVKTQQLTKEGCRVTLSVEAAPELVTKCFQNAAVQVQSRAQMQGFRAGKVPLDLVKQNFAGHIKERALDLTVKAAINSAIADAKLDAVAVPTLTKADFVNFAEGKPFTFEIAVDVAPEFEVKDFLGYDEKNGTFYYASNEGSPLRQAVWKTDRKGKKTKLSAEEGINMALFSTDFKYFLNCYTNLNTPYVITLNDNTGKTLATLVDNAALKSKMEEYDMPQKEFFTFQTSDGVTLNGWMMNPADLDE